MVRDSRVSFVAVKKPTSLFLVLTVILCCRPATSATINFTDFSSTAGLNLVGSAAQFNNRLRLTPAASRQVGGAWVTAKQQVSAGFTTSFAFEVSQANSIGADGFVFIVQNVSPTALGIMGSSLGYMDIGDGPGLDNCLAIEFDTHNLVGNLTFDNSDNHIAVQAKSTGQARTLLGTANPPFTIQNGGIHTAQISYSPGTLRVAVDGAATPLLQVSVDLDSLLGLSDGSAWIGFTASTGDAVENHDLLNWSFVPVPEPSPLCLLLIGLAATMGFRAWNKMD